MTVMQTINPALQKWAKRADLESDAGAVLEAQKLLNDERERVRYFILPPGSAEGCHAAAAICTASGSPKQSGRIELAVIAADKSFRLLEIWAKPDEVMNERRLGELIAQAIKEESGKKEDPTEFKKEEPTDSEYDFKRILQLLGDSLEVDMATLPRFRWREDDGSFSPTRCPRFLFQASDNKRFSLDLFGAEIKNQIKGKAEIYNEYSFRGAENLEAAERKNGPRPQDEKLPEPMGKLDKQKREDLADVLRQIERKRLRSVQRQFMQYMDQEALFFMRRTRTVDPQVYNWLQAAGDEKRRRNRFQAVRSYSVLALNFVKDKKLTEIIDAGKELRPELLTMLGSKEYGPIKKTTLQGLASLPRALYVKHLPSKITFLDAMPPSAWPASKPEWDALNRVIKYADVYARCMGVRPEDALRDLSRGGYGKDWAPLAARLEKNGGPEDVKDFMYRMLGTLIGPALVTAADAAGKDVDFSWFSLSLAVADVDEKKHRLVALAFKGVSPVRLFQTSKEWHDRLRTFDARIQSIALCARSSQDGHKPESDEWVPLTEPVVAPNGVTIRPLSTAAQLRDTGDSLKHCVGGYASSCMLHGSHICDLLDGEGARLSTIELQETGDEKRSLALVQNRGFGNAKPSPEASAAASWYVQQISAGALRPDWDAIEHRRQETRKNFGKSKLLRQIGFDPHDPDSVSAAFDACRPFLPHVPSEMTRDAWLEKTGIHRAAQKIVAGEGVRMYEASNFLIHDELILDPGRADHPGAGPANPPRINRFNL